MPLARILGIADPARGPARQARPLTDRPEPALPAGSDDDERRRLRRRLVRRRRDAEALPQRPSGLERPNLRELAAGISSPLFLAHIRASTGTAIQETNAHPFRHGRWLWMHNGLIREFARVGASSCSPSTTRCSRRSRARPTRRRCSTSPSLRARGRPGRRGRADGGFVEETGQRHGVEHPIQMTIATTDGRSIYAFRYSSEGESRSLFFSTRMDALKAHYPEIAELQASRTRPGSSSPSRSATSREPGTRCPSRTSGSSSRATTSCGPFSPHAVGARCERGAGRPAGPRPLSRRPPAT